MNEFLDLINQLGEEKQINGFSVVEKHTFGNYEAVIDVELPQSTEDAIGRLEIMAGSIAVLDGFKRDEFKMSLSSGDGKRLHVEIRDSWVHAF